MRRLRMLVLPVAAVMVVWTAKAHAQTATAAPLGKPPIATQTLSPPAEGRPRALDGTTVNLTFFVDSVGRVSSIRVYPAFVDAKYAKHFDEVMRKYHFKPAQDSTGKPIGGMVILKMKFGN